MYEDDRINVISEMISGILAIKTFSWEDSFRSRVKTVRMNEHKSILKLFGIKAITWSSYTYIMSVMTFVIFTYLALTRTEFDLATSFYALSILIVPRLSMTLLFPNGIHIYT